MLRGSEASQPALRVSDNNPGRTWVLTTRPALGTTAARAMATHLVKASPRSITTAVFSPPLPRPSYSGMVVKKTVSRREPPTPVQEASALRGRGRGPRTGATVSRQWRRRGPLLVAARRPRTVPGCASFRVGPTSLQGPASSALGRKRCTGCR